MGVDKFLVDLLSTPGGFIAMLGISVYLISRGVASVIGKQAEYIGAQAKEREAGTDAQENINKTYKDLYESLEKKLADETAKQESQYIKLREGQALQTEQIAHLTDEVATLKGEKNALNDTNLQMRKEMQETNQEIGELRERNKNLNEECEHCKAERSRLQKIIEDNEKLTSEAVAELIKEIAGHTARIKELETEIAALNAESPQPPPPTESVTPGENPLPAVSGEIREANESA